MNALRALPARWLYVLSITFGLVAVAPIGAFAADPIAPPPVTAETWAKWKAQLSTRTQAARMPIRAAAQRFVDTGRLGSAPAPSTVQSKRARNAYARQHVSNSKAPTATAKGKVVVPNQPAPGAAGRKVGLKMLRGAGTASVGVLAFNLSYSLTGSAMEGLFGVDSDGFVCDTGSLIGGGAADRMCGVTASPGYELNADVAGMQPGWVGTPSFSYTISGHDVSGFVDVADAPAFMDSGFVKLSVAYGYAPGVPYYGDIRPGQPRYDVFTTNPVGNPSGGMTGSLTLPSDQNNQPINPAEIWTPTTPSFDHVAVMDALGEVVASWYPEGHQLRPPVVDGNPARLFRTTWSCDVGDGGTVVGSADSASFFETDEAWPEYPQAVCEAGILTNFEVDQITDGIDAQRVYEWALPLDVADWAATYPQCADGACTLELEFLDTNTGQYFQCFDVPEGCSDWFANPAKSDLFRCTYGGQVIDLAECALYAPTFTQSLGGGLGDPVTGEKVETTQTGVAPTDPAPITGGSIWGSNPSAANCPPPFQWNSVISPWWYYQGVKCALIATFIPTDPDAPFVALSDAWGESKIGIMFVSWTGIFDVFQMQGSASCRGPGGMLGLGSATTEPIAFYPLNACDNALTDYAPTVKGVLTWASGAYFSVAILNTFAGALGFRFSEPPKESS